MNPMTTLLQTAETDVARAIAEEKTANASRRAAVQSGSKLDLDESQAAVALSLKRRTAAEQYLENVRASLEDAAEAQAKARRVKSIDLALVPALQAAKAFVVAHNNAYAIMVNAYNAYVAASGGHVEWPTGLGGFDAKRPRNLDQLVQVASELAAIDERNALVERMVADEAAE